MLRTKACLVTVLLGALTLGGCQLMLSDYERPELPYVESFYLADKYLGPEIRERFWEDFGDDRLNAVIAKALEHNLDLRKAALNVEQALLQVDISYQDRVPTLSGTGAERSSRSLDTHESWSKSSSLSLSLSYAVDLFSKIGAANRSAYENYRATAYDYWAMRLTVIKTVSAAYWQYAWAQENLKLARGDLKDSEQRVSLIGHQYTQGAVSNVEVDRAQINHLQVKKALDAAEHELHKARTALNLLLGETADKDQEIGTLAAAKTPHFALDVPARLLSRRPDLMAKEALLRKALSDYDSARLAFYPDFTLTLGLSS
nr:TolC family protein [Succinivibrio sp.]